MANVLLYLLVFNQIVLKKVFKRLFSKRELLALLFYEMALILPLFAFPLGRAFKPHIFLGEGFSGAVFLSSALLFGLLCMSIIPYLIIKRNYSVVAKLFDLLLSLLGIIVAFITVLASDGSPYFAN